MWKILPGKYYYMNQYSKIHKKTNVKMDGKWNQQLLDKFTPNKIKMIK